MNWAALLPILLAFSLRLIPGPRIVDDAYITFRYAQNLAAGNGLVFNPGEMVLGTTTPLYTLLLAGLSSILGCGDLPHLAWVLNALLDAVGIAIVHRLGNNLSNDSEHSTQPVGLIVALLWSVAPFSVTFAIGGLETSLTITLLLAAFGLHLARRDGWSALVLGLATLTRPDALIAALLIFASIGWQWIRHSRVSTQRGKCSLIKPVVIFLAVLLPWLVYATITYKSPLPHSLGAKAIAYRLGPEAALVRLLQHFGTPFHEQLLFGGRWVVVGLVLYGTLFIIGAISVIRKRSRASPLFIYPIFYAMVYAMANPLIFRWYLSPPIPFYFLGIVCGLWQVMGDLSGGRVNRRLILTGLIAMLSFASQIHAWTPHPPAPPHPEGPAPKMAWIQLEALYHQVALDLRDELATTGGRLAAADIGALGWFTQAPILDLVGLISPQAKAFFPLPAEQHTINYAVPTDLVLNEQPDFVVILEVYGRKTLIPDPSFQAAYKLWRSYPTDIYGSTAMLIFQKID